LQFTAKKIFKEEHGSCFYYFLCLDYNERNNIANMEFNIVKTSTRAKEGSSYWEKETNRLVQLAKFEQEAYAKEIRHIAGIDEAGRGPLAGPVVAGAVILPKGLLIEGVNDSKKLSEEKREKLYELIVKEALAWGVGIVDNNTIDSINILKATHLAMGQAIASLKIKPQLLLIDAEKLNEIDIPQESIVKGDALSHSIAAASIIAKVTRDRMIIKMDKKYPGYGLARHKGYGTAEHIKAIKEIGLCEIHRKTFTKNFVI
jgi:ribonuclease HII